MDRSLPHLEGLEARPHLGLEKDCPEARATEPPVAGRVVALSRVGGLHHRYTRRAANKSGRSLIGVSVRACAAP